MVVHSAHRLHMPSLLPADPLTPYLTPHNKLQCRLLAILDMYIQPADVHPLHIVIRHVPVLARHHVHRTTLSHDTSVHP